MAVNRNLRLLYGVYVVGFAVFVFTMYALETLGVPSEVILWGYMLLTVAVYAVIGYVSRTSQVSEYYVAGRSIPAVYNGMATGADWMSGASFVGMAGTLYVLGYDGLAFIIGWTGGYVLVAVLIAPYLRKFGAYTVPDFLAARYGGVAARMTGIIVLICCSFTYLTAQIYASGIIASRYLDIPFEIAVWAGLCGILFCSILGGMRAVTWTQVAQYLILMTAYMAPVVLLSIQKYGAETPLMSFLPQLTYGGALADIAELEQALGISSSYAQPFTEMSQRDFFFLIFCLMVGTASLPHILMRFFTTPTVSEARRSVGWALLFILLLYLTAPAYAAFARLNVMSFFADAGGVVAFERLMEPDMRWMLHWGGIEGHDLIRICGARVDTVEAVRAACTALGSPEGFTYAHLALDRDIIVLSTPEIAGLPWFVIGLVGAGAFAAALSTADGLLIAIANALSHDFYYKSIDPQASPRRRLFVAKVLVMVIAVLAALAASTKPADILSMVAWAFSIAASGLFSALVLGVWWSRATGKGAVAGMIAGFLTCVAYMLLVETGRMTPWWEIKPIAAGVLGVPVALLVTIAVSLVTPRPDRQTRELIQRLRIPRGETISNAAERRIGQLRGALKQRVKDKING